MLQRINKYRGILGLILLGSVALPMLRAQARAQHYILILQDPPVAERYASAERARSLEAANYRQQIEAKHQAVRNDLASRHIQVTAEVKTVLNAIFVVAPKERLAELKALPGVKGVVAGRQYHLNLNRATGLVDAPGAWNAVGGTGNAGVGMKIGMIDTGIDQTHPAFQDDSLSVPAGFPICKIAYPNGSEVNVPNCSDYTNHKVIVARSYAALEAAGSDPNNPAPDSTPDDYTPRDRVGHGTGTASAAAGVPNTGPGGLTFNGVAPKAFLGNYKVFGSPEVHDGASDDAIMLAIEDALNDGMDVASLSLGGPAFTGPLDTGSICGNPSGVPCDPLAMAVENAVQAGMVVVIAAGNDGDGASSSNAPTLNSIGSPGDAPSAITVGSTTNSHFIVDGSVQVLGSGVPSNLQQLTGQLGDGPFPGGQTGPAVDVAQVSFDTLACNALPAGSLNGAFAIIERGTCHFSDKVANAQTAGAIGVVLYMADQSPPIAPGGLGSTNIPAVMISNSDGLALKSFASANPKNNVTIGIGTFELLKPSNLVNLLSFYSSLGPSPGNNAIKPDLVATGGSENFGADIYLAAQDYDPLGELFSPSRYAAGSGTSFATPLVSGAAALVKQAHPGYSPAQIKSALVNTAAQVVNQDEKGNEAGVQQLGAGLMDAGAAVQSTITVAPSSLSLGVPTAFPISQSFQVTNTGSGSADLSLVVTPSVSVNGVNPSVDHPSLTLAPGASAAVNLNIAGFIPSEGVYSGFVTIQGGASAVHVPYMFFVSTPAVGNMIALSGPIDTLAGQDAGPIVVKMVDLNGVPISGLNITFIAPTDASLQNVQAVTDSDGVASAEAILGNTPGSNYTFTAQFGARVGFSFAATALTAPVISASSVVNAASLTEGQPIAPGSYISIFGTNLSAGTDEATTPILPLTIDFVTVSFDVPSAQLSLPGHLIFVSPNQVNVQVPWELQGQSSVQMKVTQGDGFGLAFGNVVTVPLANYSPAFFEGGGQVAALDSKANVITSSNPAMAGQSIQIYANALGPVTNQPASGDPAPSSPLAECSSAVTVTIGTTNVTPDFCGLAPGFSGLYQLNVTVPSSLAAGSYPILYPITVTAGGQTSKASSIPVR
ncbi:MAG TPA: S8 family serine peptidase [Bryobacteraceae bacterium]|nr:S8 family serine peptidase [Bryobacteraceae bacterium]